MASQDTNTVALGDTCVLGLGKTGLFVARYLADRRGGRVRSVTLYGGASSVASDETRALEKAGVRVVLGSEDVTGDYDLTIASPGISEFSDFFGAARACSREIIGEPEFAWRESSARWVGITGTNGKTTTTTLTTALLHAGGMDALSVGNIGYLATKAVCDRDPQEWFVAELSSFQLACSSQMHPRVACLLNITPDHVAWHRSLENYAAAKEKIFQNLTGEDLAIVSNGDDWCRAVIDRLAARPGLRLCVLDQVEDPQTLCAAFIRDGVLVVRLDGREHLLCRADQMVIKGAHNVENALAAAAIACELGVSDAAITEALATFAPLEHRIEPCGELGGVAFVNDSKATNVDAVEKALGAFDPGSIVLLAGGHDKGTELQSLADRAAETCAAVVCFGEAGPRLSAALAKTGNQDLVVTEAAHLEEALDAALELATPGQTILLSPACSSFDEFSGFEERGRVFKELVSARIAAAQEA